MKNFLTLWRREVAACFLSPIAYVIMVVFLGASACTFFVGALRNVGQTDPLPPLLCGTVLIWLGILIPVITMRLFAEEKRAGTIETLMTAPVTETEVVLSKYAGALTFLLLVMSPVAGYVGILMRLSPSLTLSQIDAGALAGSLLILLLLSAFFTAVGLLVSLTTRNQIVAAVFCFALFWLGLLLGWLMSLLPGARQWVDDVSATVHVEEFCRGSVSIGPVVLYLTGTWLILFTSIRLLESRRWR